MSEILNLNQTTPAAPAGYENGAWQKGGTPAGTDPTSGNPYYDCSVNVPSTGGVSAKTSSYTAVAGDNGKLLSFNSASAVTLTLPSAAPFASWNIAVENIGAGTLTISPNGLDLDGSTSSITVPQNQGVYIATDGTNYFTERGIQAATDANLLAGVIGIVIDGGGATPTTGLKGFIQIPYNATITGWSMIADQSGSASIDVWFLAGSAPPTAPSVPTSTNKISASAPPDLSTAQSAAGGSSAISTWNTAISKWGTMAFNLTAVATVTRIILEIQVTKS